MLLTVILIIIISFPSPTLFFIPDLKPSFCANPSHCSCHAPNSVRRLQATDSTDVHQ